MSTKPFQIKMNKHSHALLKQAAHIHEISIGNMVENLIVAYQQRVYQYIQNNGRNILVGDGTIRLIGELLLLKDCEQISEDDMKAAIAKHNTKLSELSLRRNPNKLAVTFRTDSETINYLTSKKED